MSNLEILPPGFYRRPAAQVARDLLGRHLVRTLPDGIRLELWIVETEAYLGQGDRASHAWRGPVTPRSRRLFRDGGHAYVYLIYGMHLCLNAVAGTAEDGSAVLLRAGDPVAGAERMAGLRGLPHPASPRDLASGPGKLAQAIALTREHDGRPLWQGDLVITAGTPCPDVAVATTPRVGVAYAGAAASWPLRFVIRGNPAVSKPRVG
jgi:DNA-3-methyladenine glycosylase